jgi:hypothetical protein
MNRARLQRWQGESANRTTWTTKGNQEPSKRHSNAAQELAAAANNARGEESTSWIDNVIDNSTPLELAVMGGVATTIATAIAPEVIFPAVGYIGSAMAFGGPTAEVGILAGAIGDAALLQAGRFGGR